MTEELSKPMRVLLVSNVYPVDERSGTPSIGIQQHILESFGVEFEVISISTGSKWAYIRNVIRFLLMNLKPPRYDLIHAYYGLSVYIATLQKKIPVVGTFLGSDLINRTGASDRDRQVGLRAAKKADAVIVMSPEMKAESGREDSYVIPFGANLAEFELLNKETARHRLNLPNGKKYILFPWNPSRKVKRFDLIEEACQILQRRLPDVELVVIHDLPQSEVVLYMNACDVLVLASDHEGSPVAVREAMACNLPVVSTDVGDVREVLAGVSQAVIVEQSPVAIAEGLYRVLSDSARSDGRAKMEQYDMMTASCQVLDVYHSVVESRRRSDD